MSDLESGLPVEGRGAGDGEAASATSWLAAFPLSPAISQAFARLRRELLFFVSLFMVADPLTVRRKVGSLDCGGGAPSRVVLVPTKRSLGVEDRLLMGRFCLSYPGTKPGGKGGGVVASR